MPRTGRGGARVGSPGVSHSQRSDLNETRQPVMPVSGPTYGDRQASIDAQKIAPLPATPATAAPPPSPAGAPAGPPAAGGPSASAAPVTMPTLPSFTGPTERPNEPLTAGLSTGAGPGPEVLGLPTGAPDLGRLADYLPALEVLANRPGTTQEMRNFVRLVRANAPTGA